MKVDSSDSAPGALYFGRLRHRRFGAVENRFSYPLFMAGLDLGALDRLRVPGWLLSTSSPALLQMCRRDYLGDPGLSLGEAVRREVAGQTGARPRGKILFLGNLRNLGCYFSPVNFYYCLAPEAGSEPGLESVEAIVVEVVNTPWGERHLYVLGDTAERHGQALEVRLGKEFHVSPFMHMDHAYTWRFTAPGEKVAIHMENHRGGERVFDATLSLERRELSTRNLAAALLRHPWLPAKILLRIYLQAARLYFVKRVPFYPHPKERRTRGAGVPRSSGREAET